MDDPILLLGVIVGIIAIVDIILEDYKRLKNAEKPKKYYKEK